MAEEEAEMTYDKLNYEVLAQIYTIINDNISQKTIAMENVLKKDFDINYVVPEDRCSLPNIAGRTALDFALDKGELEIFKLLIRSGANFTDKNRSRTTILHRIIEKSYVNNKSCYALKGKLEHPFVQSILSAHVESNEVVNPCDRNGVSHFHIACMFNDTQAIEYFLAQGVCVNQAINHDSTILPGYTPLHLSARYSAYEATKMLLDHNANFELKDSHGAHPLHLLLQRNTEISDWVNVQKQKLCDKLKDELVINEKIVELLIEQTRNKEEDISSCQVACTLQNTRILERTMEEGANLNDSVSGNSPFWPGYTALHFAAIFNINAVRLLLANGANVLAKDPNGITPLDLCLQRYPAEIIHSIISTVAELNDITFVDTNTKLCDLVLAMSDECSLRTFLQDTAINVNMVIPFDSPVWPGYSILHIAIILSDRIYKDKNPYKDTDYKVDEDWDWPYCRESEYFKRIKLCLTMDADVVVTDLYNCTPLHLAFRLDNRIIVELLLEHHHKLVDVIDSGNLSHLHIACAVQRNEFVKKLLQTGADVNRLITSTFDFVITDDEDDTPQVLHVNPGLTCLHIAMASWDDSVETLIEYGADLYATDSFGMTPIHQILRLDSCISELYVSLPEHCENRSTSFGLTHLHIACFAADLKAVKVLVKNRADIEARINYNKVCSTEAMAFVAPLDGYTPLLIALREHHLEIVKFLVRRGANLFAKSADGITPLYEALKIPFNRDGDDNSGFYSKEGFSDDEEYGDSDGTSGSSFALELLSDKKIKKLVKKHSGITKLHIACLSIKRRQVSNLLENGADPNARINVDSPIWPGYTPLHLLMIPRFTDDDDHEYQPEIYSEIKEIGTLLLEYGACVMLKDVEGNTPIHMAPQLMWSDCKIEEARLHRVGWILEDLSDFTVNPVDARGISHFEVACMTGRNKVVRKFLKQGVDVNRHFGYFTARYGGFTPLHLASFYKARTVVNILVNYGADPHAKDFLGNTPLHTAAVYCRLGLRGDNSAIYETLLSVEADAEAKNLWNEPPLAVFLRMGLSTNSALYSIVQNNGSIEDYIEIIHEFIKLDFDIDCQDNRGQTALHKAACFGNYKAVIGLLMNGADINIVDASNKPAFAYSLERKEKEEEDVEVVRCKILRAFLLHVYKLQIAGLEISDANQEFVAQIRELFLLSLSCMEMQSCITEIESLKIHTISNSYYVTMYNFLSETTTYLRIMLFFRNTIDEIFVKNAESLRNKYPLFAGLLQMQYRNIYIRSQLLEPAKTALRILAGFEVPDLCCDEILKYLKTNDLKKVISATEFL